MREREFPGLGQGPEPQEQRAGWQVPRRRELREREPGRRRADLPRQESPGWRAQGRERRLAGFRQAELLEPVRRQGQREPEWRRAQEPGQV